MPTVRLHGLTVDTRVLEQRMRGFQRDQLPYAMQLATNDLANDTIRVERIEMQTVLDRPRPFVLRGLRMLKWAKKKDPNAVIGFTDIRGRYGNRVENTIRPQIEGRSRSTKGVEVALRAKGHLKPNEYLVAGKNAPLDASGNLTLAEHRNMMNGLDGKGPGRKRYFINRTERFSAIYSATGKRGRPRLLWIITTDRPNYRPRFDFYGEAQRHAARYAGYFAEQAMRKALKTSR